MPDDYDLNPIDYTPQFAEPFAIPQTPVTPEQTEAFRTFLRNTAGAPGVAMQPVVPERQGWVSDADIARQLATDEGMKNWAARQAVNTVGQGAPMAVEGAAGVAGGKLRWISPKQALKMSDEDFAKLRPSVKHSETGEIRIGTPEQSHNELIGPNAVDADTSSPWQRGFLPPEPTPPIRAYHGSPHDFERFDTSKIGTGEGAQSYGHGLYFAEHPEVARGYRERLAGGDPDKVHPDEEAIAAIKPKWDELTKQLRDEWEVSGGRMTEKSSALQNHLDALNDHAISDTLSRKPWLKEGRMYEVDINAHPEHFLDWDKPLSEQHPKVQEAMQPHVDAAKEEAYHRALSATSKQRADELWDMVKNPTKASGQMFLDKMQSRMGKEKVAEALREAGIPGIKYLDQGSRQPVSDFTVWAPRAGRNEQFEVRGPGNEVRQKFDTREAANAFADSENKRLNPQTSNYVVFDDKLIDIIKKYGLAGLVAGGAGHFATKAVDYTPQFDDAKHAKGGAVKLSHASVGYMAQSTHLPQKCGRCTMFLPPSGCTLVQSPIKPQGWCRRFEGKR